MKDTSTIDLVADCYEELHALTEAYYTAVVMPAPEVRYSDALSARDEHGEVAGAGW